MSKAGQSISPQNSVLDDHKGLAHYSSASVDQDVASNGIGSGESTFVAKGLEEFYIPIDRYVSLCSVCRMNCY